MDNVKLVTGNKNITDITCMFDKQEYSSKPNGNEVGQIKNRIENNVFTTYKTIKEIQEEFIKGKTCIPSAIRGEETRKLSHLLVFITAVIHNLDSGEEKLELAVRIKGKWKKGIFLKSQVYGNPIELANFGIPINSSNLRWFVKYLAELEAENQDTIPVIEAVTKLGWRNGHFIPFSTEQIKVDIDYKLEKWVNAYITKGTLQEWVEAIRPYRKNNLFRFILASSFTAPLLEPLGHRIFMVFNWGNSRAGKTSALHSALSIWR